MLRLSRRISTRSITPKEDKIQSQICKWLKMAYPQVIFTCDLSSGMKLTIGQAVKASTMRSSRGLPDLMIFEPKGPYKGAMIELKRKGVILYNRNGTTRSDKHLHEQNAILDRLKNKGYYAVFSCGFEETIRIINNYMALK